MKRQKFELSHDIIAEKIWARLPEQDKQLRQIQRSIAQRQEDYQAKKGSLLGKAELDAWRIYLPLLELSEEQKVYIDQSTQALEAAQQAELNRLDEEKKQLQRSKRLQSWIAITLIVATLISAYFIWNASLKTTEANEVQKIALEAQIEAKQEKEKADDARIKAEIATEKAREAKVQEEKATKEAEEARLRAESAEDNAKEAIELADKKTEEARIAGENARIAGIAADTAEAKAKVSFSTFLVSEATLSFNRKATSTAFRLNQQALTKDPDNQTAKDKLDEYVDYLGRLECKNVESYKLSPDSLYIALVISENQRAYVHIYHLGSSVKVLSSELPQYSSNRYSDSYRFSEGGAYFACLIKQGKNTHCTVYTLNGQQMATTILPISEPLQYSDSNGYSDSYRFSEGETYFACLIKQGKTDTHCQVYALNGQQTATTVLTSEPLQYSNDISDNYSDSYRFSEGGTYFACVIKQGENTHCTVYALNGQQMATTILPISEPLQYSDNTESKTSYRDSYRFSEGGAYFACLIKQGKNTHCTVYTLNGQQMATTILPISEPLQYSDNTESKTSYRYSYRFSEGGAYFACLIKQKKNAHCKVYALNGQQMATTILPISEPLQYSDDNTESKTSYRDSYRFSEGGAYFACLIKQGKNTHYTVYALNGQQTAKTILTSEPLQYSYLSYVLGFRSSSYSYRFSEGGAYFACVIKQGENTHCTVYALNGQQMATTILPISEPLQYSDNTESKTSYRDSYRFSEGGAYFACLIKQGKNTHCTVYTLNGQQMATTILPISEPLQYSYRSILDGYNFKIFNSIYSNSYCFSEGEVFFACLIEQGENAYCTVYALNGQQTAAPIFTSERLELLQDTDSDGYKYSDSYRFSEDEVLLYLEKNDTGILHVYNLNRGNTRKLKDLSEIDSYTITADQKQVVYLTKDKRLKVVDITIPQAQLIDYYNDEKIIPLLTEEERVRYRIN